MWTTGVGEIGSEARLATTVHHIAPTRFSLSLSPHNFCYIIGESKLFLHPLFTAMSVQLHDYGAYFESKSSRSPLPVLQLFAELTEPTTSTTLSAIFKDWPYPSRCNLSGRIWYLGFARKLWVCHHYTRWRSVLQSVSENSYRLSLGYSSTNCEAAGEKLCNQKWFEASTRIINRRRRQDLQISQEIDHRCYSAARGRKKTVREEYSREGEATERILPSIRAPIAVACLHRISNSWSQNRE